MLDDVESGPEQKVTDGILHTPPGSSVINDVLFRHKSGCGGAQV